MEININSKILLQGFKDLLTPHVSINLVIMHNSNLEFHDYKFASGLKKIKSIESEELKNRIAIVITENKEATFKGKIGRKIEKIILLPATVDNNSSCCFLIRFDVTVLEETESRLKYLNSLANFDDSIYSSSGIELNTSLDGIRTFVSNYCFKNNLNVFSLSNKDKKKIVFALNERGLTNLKNSIPFIAELLKITRATIYNYLKK